MAPLERDIIDEDVVDKKARPSLELSLRDMEREIVRLQQSALRTRMRINRCSAVSDLPPEILSEIFMLCCQPEYNAIGRLKSQGICPLRLGAVCKPWRDLAWITSQLWSSIFLINPKPSAVHLEEVLISWLARSGDRPLSIRYDSPRDGSLFNRLVGFALRWANVAVFLPVESLYIMKDSTVFPLLEHLSMRTPSYLPDRNLDGLSDLEILDPKYSPILSHLHVPTYLMCNVLVNLTTFSVSSIYPDDLYKIFRFAVFLKSLVANNLVRRPGGLTYKEPHLHLHPHLRRLSLKDASAYALEGLLPRLSTPNLEDLTIRISRGSPVACLSNFMCYLHNKLQRLNIKFFDPEAYCIVGFILNMPSLTELHVQAPTSALAILIFSLGPRKTKRNIYRCLRIFLFASNMTRPMASRVFQRCWRTDPLEFPPLSRSSRGH